MMELNAGKWASWQLQLYDIAGTKLFIHTVGTSLALKRVMAFWIKGSL